MRALSLFSALLFVTACSTDRPSFGSPSNAGGGTGESGGDGDGDGGSSGDGDTDSSSGDGGGDTHGSSGDGDGDTDSSSGDGDGDTDSSSGDGDGDDTSGSGGDGSTGDGDDGSGASGSGGDDGSGGSGPVHRFVGGPCVMSPDSAVIEVLARGDDGHIHRAIENGGTWEDWTTVSNLDPGVLDVLSDLDCDSNGGIARVVANGANPSGSIMQATGLGSAFNAFSRILDGSTFERGVSVTQLPTNTNYSLVAMSGPIPQGYSDSGSGSLTPFATEVGQSFSSAPDIIYKPVTNATFTFLVGYTSTTSLSLFRHLLNGSYPNGNWGTPSTLAAPSGIEYEFSPTVCVDESSGNLDVQIAAVAGGELHHTMTDTFNEPLASWENLGVEVGTAPDCIKLADGSVHIIALSPSGHILDVNGTSGSFSVDDLGTF